MWDIQGLETNTQTIEGFSGQKLVGITSMKNWRSELYDGC